MGVFNFTSANRPEPLVISVKRVGDSQERFLARNGNIISFDEDSGDGIAYEVVITDANGKVSRSTETLSCVRPADCTEGPTFQGELVSFGPNGITYQFHGVNVQRIRRDILQNGIIIDSRIDEPTSALVTSNFSTTLAAGNYVARIQGESCFSPTPSTRNFVITDDDTQLDWWPNYPRYDYSEFFQAYRIISAINKAGTYPTKITRISNGELINQQNVDFEPGSLFIVNNIEPGQYLIEVGPLTYTITVADAPEECDAGPELLTVKSLSPTQTQFTFHGVNVQVIEWFIRTPSDTIEHTGTIQPGGSTVTITHPALSGGSHNLLIRGSSCTSQTGIVDNLDFSVTAGTLQINSVTVSQLADGRYQLNVNFQGGSPNYTITVRGANNNTIAIFPNTTGSPANITLPAGTGPQTVKVLVMDVTNATDEETGILLGAPVMTMNFMQAPNSLSVMTRTPMPADGATFFIGPDPSFVWDVEAVLPNGGLWDYIEKRLRKKVGGSWVEKSIQSATSQPQNYSVPSSSGAERLWLPRVGQAVSVDGVNVFKTGAEWEFRAIARKGGVGGQIVSQLTRTFTISAPPTLSGIILYPAGLDGSLGSAIGEVNSVGSSYAKPKPRYDLAITDFGGAQFRLVRGFFRQKVNDSFVQRYSNAQQWDTPQTSINPNDWSLFDGANFANVHVSILADQAQTWEIEFIAYADLQATQVVGTRKAIFNFTLGQESYPNAGFDNYTVNNRYYQVIKGMDFGADILPSGNVRVYHPATRQSINGQKTVYPWLYINHLRMHPDDLAAIRGGSGLSLPEGKYTFTIKWHSNVVENYDDVVDGGSLGSAYYLAGEQTNISYANSGMDDYFTVTIRSL